jgi:hypothetical protein
MLRNLYLAGLIFLFSLNSAFAQVGSGSLKGKLTDSETGEPLPFVNIVVQRGDQQIAGGATDFDGVYTIKPIPPGTYNVLVSYVGYNAKQVSGVVINSNKITFLDIPMESGIKLEEFEVVEYEVPLIDKDGGSSGGTVTREEIAKMPGRDANSFAATVGGVQDQGDGQLSVRGARTENTWYYIDGVKVRGNQTNLPKAAIEEVSVITGGVPANYGDATGGIVSITTRGATSQWFGGIDVLTSGFANADGDGVGLDRFSQTQIEGVLSGPLLWKKNAEGEKIRPLVGFFVSANYRNFLDNRPTIGNFRLTDEAQSRLTANPISYRLNGVEVNQENSFIIDDNGDIQQVVEINPQVQGNQNAEFLREDDWEEVPARQNDRQQGVSLTGKLDFALNPTMDLSFGGTFDFVNDNLYSYNNSLMNYANNGESQNTAWRVFGRFTQRFGNPDEEDDGLIKNVFYSVMVDYSQRRFRQWDPTHEDRLFNYGYVGAFETTTTPNYVFDPDTLGGVFINQGDRELQTTFTPSEINTDIAAYTSTLFDFYEQNGFTLRSFDQIDAAGAILNGRALPSIYNLYTAIGAPFNAYQLFDQDQFRVSGSFSADVGDHAITFGVEYEQFTERNFSASPRGLWEQARVNTNRHLQQFDRNSDPEVTQIGTNTFLTFDRLIGDNQGTFDRNLRLALGLDPNGDDIINVDGVDPNLLSLDMFSPDELFVTGGTSSLVGYYGFDYTGERQRGTRPTIDDFFTQTDENGMLTRPIGAFQPIYAAGYIMDKFAFDDIIFNVGLRVDLFDANQPVLKDQFVIGNAATVDDTRNASASEGNNLSDFADQHPGVVGGDWVVYVDDVNSPTQINGYRDGNTWYNASGVEIPDPRAIRGASGIAPLLIDPEAVGEDLNGDAFEDYEQQVNVMPRIAFSFPISDEAVFFAHYDILTQRPLTRNVVNPLDYLFIQNIGQDLVNNPNLRPTRTIDYEIGFQQVLSRSSSLKIAGFYRDTQDEVQARNLLEAFPVTYTSFDNFDFGTTQGLTLTYDLRRTGNVTLRVAYTLQFAAATGSNSTSAVNLVNSGEPNLRVIFPTDRDQRHLLITTFDYRYGSGKDYNGPVIGGKQILANAGLNLVGTFGSGTPYSRQQFATGTQLIGNTGAPQLEGTVNGSRLPSQFRVNLQLDKSFTLNIGKEGERQKQALLNVYLLVNNLLNAQNIIAAYRFTGNPDDDGYLASPQFLPAINNQIDPESFRQMYALKVASPFNYSIPRTIQLGVRLDF